jgi:hypothetical protein
MATKKTMQERTDDLSEKAADEKTGRVPAGRLLAAKRALSAMMLAALETDDTEVLRCYIGPYCALAQLAIERDAYAAEAPAREEDEGAREEPTAAGALLLERLRAFEQAYRGVMDARANEVSVDPDALYEAVDALLDAADEVGYYRRLKDDV